ncbi:MAG: zinc-dependent metalloprotease [Bifidobacteriaceae bacterium]|jgi:putative hydrolase|nr:zinc-dependent metalloprotease [Bifidobacteriaceae bacterium]
MSVEPGAEGRDLPPEFIELIQTLFGDAADQALEAFRQADLNPDELLQAADLGTDPQAFAVMARQVRQFLAQTDGSPGISPKIVHDAARAAALSRGPAVEPTWDEVSTVQEAFKVADLWLDQSTELDAPSGPVSAISPTGWIDATLERWQRLTRPVAESMIAAMTNLLDQQTRDHPGLGPLPGEANQALSGMAGPLFSMQIGQALGLMSREVFGYSDTGLPLAEPGAVALAPAAVAEFARQAQVPADEVRLFLASRESAHARLLQHVPWLADRLMSAVETYAAGVKIDLEQLEQAMRELEGANPAAIRQALASGVFAPVLTERQKTALNNMETALALVEGWVSVVTEQALRRNLPDIASLSEMMRRRRATGGPAEHAMATLAGLELRPRRARQAGQLWHNLTEQLGPLERDQLWSHPDLLPSSEDLDDPEHFLERRAARAKADEAIDAEIAAFFDELD